MTSANDIFSILDVKGQGYLTMEAIFSLTEGILSPPDASRIYSRFEVNGRITLDELGSLLRAVEQKTNLPIAEVLARYMDGQYRQLFELVDEDKGGTISRDEMKPLLENLNSIFGLKTTADVGILFRSCGIGLADELDMHSFKKVILKLIGNRPIALVVRGFQEAKGRNRFTGAATSRTATACGSPNGDERKWSKSLFRAEAASPKAVGFPSTEVERHGPCSQCQTRESEVGKLSRRIQDLESQLLVEQQRNISREFLAPNVEQDSRDDTFAREVMPKSKSFARRNHARGDDDPSKALWKALERSERVVSIFQHSSKLNSWAQESSQLSALVEECLEKQQGLSHIVKTVAKDVAALAAAELSLIHQEELQGQQDNEDEESLLGATRRSALQSAAACHDGEITEEDIERLTEACEVSCAKLCTVVAEVQRSRAKLANLALVASQLSSNRQKVIRCGLEFERTGGECIALVASLQDVVRQRASTPLSCSAMSLRQQFDAACDLRHEGEQAATFLSSLSTTLQDLHAALAVFFSKKKERSCQTKPVSDADGNPRSPSPGQRSGSPSMGLCHSSSTQGDSAGASRAPRFRGKRPWESRGPERVDTLVQQHLSKGVAVPPNFGRVTSSAGKATLLATSLAPSCAGHCVQSQHAIGVAGRNTFLFGTKRIDLTAIDDNTLCVVVGGGFLLFSEYCAKHTEFETMLLRKQNRSVSPNRSPSIGSASPPR